MGEKQEAVAADSRAGRRRPLPEMLGPSRPRSNRKDCAFFAFYYTSHKPPRALTAAGQAFVCG
jgi:hypothetical protein